MNFNHIISAGQFDKKSLQEIFILANKIKSGKFNRRALSGKIMATLFYEPSTRTRFSFESAMLKLGGKVISTENASAFSSVAKGETLEDTIRIIHSYSDVIVLRHNKRGASEVAIKYSKVPIINAGDGNGEHPTQALLDLYTIFSKFRAKGSSSSGGENANITIAMIGDLLNGRTIHSLTQFLSLYPNIELRFISPKALAIPNDLRNHLRRLKIRFIEQESFTDGIKNVDIIYQTRIQKERFKSIGEYKKYFGKYIINKDILKIINKNAVILHPLPRVNEITQDVDNDKRAIYFQQAQNGLYIRMALLLSIFDKPSPKKR